jgi:hypothetical protein
MKIQKRFRLKLENDLRWTVVDIFTGTPVRIGSDFAFGLLEQEAFDLALQLNEIEARRIVLKAQER